MTPLTDFPAAPPSMDHSVAVREANRETIANLERNIRALPDGERMSFQTLHDFCPGIYARTSFMPAGYLATMLPNTDMHFFTVTKGKCVVFDSDGTRLWIDAPFLGVALVGAKRAVQVNEDCIWTSFHTTDLACDDIPGQQALIKAFEGRL